MFRFRLKPGETLLAMRRQAEISLALTALTVMLLIYLPSAFLIQYGLFLSYKWIALSWSFLVLLYFLNRYMLWLLNVYLITSQRVVSVGYKNLLHKTVDEIALRDIGSVSVQSRGLGHLFFGLGTVTAKAGQGAEVRFPNIKHPEEIKDFMVAHSQKHRAAAGSLLHV